MEGRMSDAVSSFETVFTDFRKYVENLEAARAGRVSTEAEAEIVREINSVMADTGNLAERMRLFLQTHKASA
jgi:hypothetical protein